MSFTPPIVIYDPRLRGVITHLQENMPSLLLSMSLDGNQLLAMESTADGYSRPVGMWFDADSVDDSDLMFGHSADPTSDLAQRIIAVLATAADEVVDIRVNGVDEVDVAIEAINKENDGHEKPA